jgi:hypothetical protein
MSPNVTSIVGNVTTAPVHIISTDVVDTTLPSSDSTLLLTTTSLVVTIAITTID